MDGDFKFRRLRREAAACVIATLGSLRRVILLAATSCVLQLVACSGGGSGSEETGNPSRPYGHPGATGGGSTNTTQGRLAKLVDGEISDDLTVELATTSLTVRGGTYQTAYQALLTDLAGEIIESNSLKLLSLPVRVRLSDEGGIFDRTDSHRDLEITVTAAKSATIHKAVLLIIDYDGVVEGEPASSRSFIRLSALGSAATTNADGKLTATIKGRSANFGIAMISAETGDPAGYSAYKEPPVDPVGVLASSDAPDKAVVKWRAQRLTGQGFAVAYGLAPVAPLCSDDFAVTATETSTAPTLDASGKMLYEYRAEIDGLADNTTYALRVCASNDRSPKDYSGPGAGGQVTTVARARAVLSGTPATPTTENSIFVTVGGDGLVTYKKAVIEGSSCVGAVYGTWTNVATPISESGLTESIHTLCVLGKINDTNVQLVPTTHTWEVDRTPPTITVLPALDAIVLSGGGINLPEAQSDQALHNAATVTGGAVLVQYKVSGQSVACSTETFSGAHNNLVKSGAISADGNWKICVRAADAAGNAAYGESSSFVADITPPVFISGLDLAGAAANGFVNSSEVAVVPGSDLASAPVFNEDVTKSYALIAGTETCGSAANPAGVSIPTTTELQAKADSSWKVCLKAVDQSDNPATYQASPVFILDTVAPSLASGFAWDGAAADFYLNASERTATTAILGAAVADETSTYQYTVLPLLGSCATASDYASGLPAADTTKITADGSYLGCVEMTDSAGNVTRTQSAAAVTVDTVEPSATMELINAASDSKINGAEKSSVSTEMGDQPAPSEPLSAKTYKLIPSATSCDQSLVFGAAIPPANSSDFGADGDYRICMKLIDQAGNSGYSTSDLISLDTTAPVFSSIAFANEASDGYINLAEKDATTDMVEDPVVSGADVAEYKVAANTATCSSLSSYSSTKPKVNDAEISADGSWKVCVRLSDTAGNVTYGESSTVVRDIVAPTLSTGFAWDGAAADFYLNASERAATTAILSAAVADETSTYQYTVLPLLGSCATASDYASGLPAADTTKITADGSYLGCVEMADTAGNVTRTQSASAVVVDTAAPTATMALINAASDSKINGTEKSSLSTAMGDEPVASEALSAKTYKLIASATSCDSSLSFGSSMPAANSADFGVDGDYKICMKLVDVAGNAGYSASGLITLDTTGPVFTSIAFTNEASDGYVNLAEKDATTDLVASPVVSGADVTEYKVAANTATCSSLSSYSSTKPKVNDAEISADGSWKVCVKLSDAAGNVTYGESSAVVRDIVAPALSTGFAWSGAAADSYLNASERAATTAILSAAVADETSTYQYTVLPLLGSCATASDYASGLPAADTTKITADGSYLGCVEIADTAGNVTRTQSASVVVVDTAAPTATMALINAASDSKINGTEKSSLSTAMGDEPVASEAISAKTYKLIASA
ncbi:MAG: hypothetical protein RIQ81_1352, partial [Pseudomonadota bacterium]